MNRIFRLVWNRTLGVLQVASELAHSPHGGADSGRGTAAPRRHPLTLACLAVLALCSGVAAPDVWANTTPLNGTFTIITPAGVNSTDSDTLIDGSSPGALVKDGAGTLVLTGTDTYTGSTTIDAGTLKLFLGGSIASSSGVDVGSGAIFDISQNSIGNSSGATITSLSGNGSVALGGMPLTLTNASGTFAGVMGDNGQGGSLTLAGGTEILTGANTYTGTTTINANTNLQLGNGGSTGSILGNVADNGFLVFNLSSNTTFNGSIAGTGALTLNGPGTVTLTAANTYSGNTNINAGTLALSGSGSIVDSSTIMLYAGTFDISQTSNGASVQMLFGNGNVNLGAKTLTLTNAVGGYSGVIGDNGLGGSLVINGALMELGGANTYTGTTSLNSGQLVLLPGGSIADSSNLIVASGTTFDISNTSGTSITSLSGNGTVDLGNQALTLTQANGNFGGVISDGGMNGGTGGSLVLAGGNETLSGTSTYTGSTTINAGTLALTGAGSIASSSGVNVGSGATFDISGANGGASITSLSGSGTVNIGGGTLTLTNASGTFSGAISDGGMSGNLTLDGGTETLTSFNPIFGVTTINAGTLVLSGSGGIFHSSDVNIAAAGTLDLSGANIAQFDSLDGSGKVNMGAQMLTLINASGTFSGVLSGSGSFSLVAGTETLSGANTYTGSTFVGNGGVLNINNTAALSSTSTLRFDNGTLQLNNAALPGSAQIILYDGGGTLAFNESGTDTQTIQGQISGTGGLTIESTNQLEDLRLLNGSNSYQGGTTIFSAGGNLVLVTAGVTGALGSGNVTVGQNAVLEFVDALGKGSISAGSQTFKLTTSTSELFFSQNSSADLATIDIAGGRAHFYTGSDAGQAQIQLGNQAQLTFDSTADSATIQNSGQSSMTMFENGATAGNANIQNTGLNAETYFNSGTTAGNATISNTGPNTTTYFTSASAGSATITNSHGGSTYFNDSDAGSATLINNSGSSITLAGTSNAANATIVNNGYLFIQGLQNASISPSIGSLSGSGLIDLDGNYGTGPNTLPFTLTLGGLNKNDTISGVITDSMDTPQSIGDSLAKIGTGTLTLTANNAFSGGVQINAGAVAIGNSGALGSGGTDMLAGTALDFIADGLSLSNNFTLTGATRFDVANGMTGTITGVISDGATSGTLQKIDGGTLVLTGDNAYSGGTTISGGTLSVSGDGNLGVTAGAVTLDGGTLQITGNTYNSTNHTLNLTSNGGDIDIADATNAFTVGQSINSNGHLSVSGAGALLLTGSDRFSGGITINNGNLQIGNGGTNGAIASDIVDNGTLAFNESNAVLYSNALSGSGNVIQQGTGALVLSGSNSSAFTGTTTVANGQLIVGDAPGNATLGGNVIVNAGATVGGFGTIGGNVNVLSGGNINPGSLTGTLTVNGNVTAAQGSVMNVFPGAPGANFQTFGTSANLQVNGNLVLNGLVLNAYSSSMGPGVYNLFTYGGTLSESNGGIVLGSVPAGQTMQVQYLTASKQINLLDTTGYTLNMWNANGQASATQMGGGSGTWSATSATWTNSDGSVPNALMQPQPGFAVFGGAPGMVTIDDSAGAVGITGIQFFSTGYLLNGDALQLIGLGSYNATTINVGDGSAASVNNTATINSVLTGNTGLLKTDYGTLVLGGANTYSGATTIQGGMLALANNGSLANTQYVEVDSGAIFDISSTAQGASIPTLQGSGTVSLGNKTLTLTGGGRFDGFIQGSGGLTFTSGTTQLTGASAYTGTTTIGASAELDLLNNGSMVNSTLNVLSGGTFSQILTNNGASFVSLQGSGYVDTGLQTLTLTNAADTFDGVIGGYGALALSSGTETLTGANTYTGLTTIQGGTLALSGNGSIADSTSLTINSGGTFDISATNGGASVTALAGNGNINLGAQTLTVTNASSQFYGSINGSGNLSVDGGTLLLYGANTYTGSTTINAGAYVISENAQALTNSTAFHLNGGELDVMSSSFTTSAAVTLGTGTNTIATTGNDIVQLDGQVSGSGGLAFIGLGGGTLILTNSNNSYQGGTTISNQLANTTALEVKATGALGSGDVSVGASTALDFIGTTSNLVSAGTRTITVDNGGSVSFANYSTLGSITLNLANGAQGDIGGASVGDAHINNSGLLLVEDAGSGNAVLTNVGSTTGSGGVGGPFAYTGGIIGFLGNDDMSHATVVNNTGGAVMIGGIYGDPTALSIGSLSGGGDVLLANNNPNASSSLVPLTLTLGGLNQNDTIGGVIDDSVLNNGQSAGDSVTKIGTGTLTLTGANTYTGITTINGGTLQLGNGGSSGSLAGNIVDNAALVFNRSDAVNYGGTLSGGGTIAQQGTGTLTLDGNNSAFTGTTTVANGSLIVGSVIGNGATLGGNVVVDNGATLAGLGTIGGDVNVQSGGIVTPGNTFGLLTVNGNFTAAQNSVLNESFGAPTPNFLSYGNGTSVKVGGDLTLNGLILNVTDAGGMGPGLYEVFTYGGALNLSNGGITLGSTPAGQTLQLQYLASSKQINLVDTSGLTLNMWNANGHASAGRMGGGSGTWSVTSQMWTDANGDIPNVAIQPQPGFAVFGGTPGTVTVDDSAGSVAAAGMQFAVDGYTLTGGALALVGSNGSAPVIRVGDGSSAGAGMTAIIGNVITGSDGLVKTDLGTLVLTGNNTYTGGTTISGGSLQIGTGGNTGAISGNVVNNGALVFDRSDAASFAGVISGSGSLSQNGSGTLTLTGVETFTGSTTINAGKLALSGSGSIAASNHVSVGSGASFDISGVNGGASITSLSGAGSVNLGNQTLSLTQASGSFSGVISGNGGVTLASGNETLSGTNTYTGITTIDSNATLILSGNLTTSSNVINHGTLDVSASTSGVTLSNLSGDGALVLGSKPLTLSNTTGTYAGVIAGNGGLVLSGDNEILTGSNTFSGGITINHSTLSVSSDANLGAASGVLTFDGGTLAVSGHTFTGTARTITLGSNGGTLDIADAANTFTLGQSLSGSGALAKSGAGTLILAGNNSYGGGTSISAGTLQLGNGGTTGSVTGNIANNGTLVFDRSDAVSFDGVISGNGSLTKQGAGSLTLTGANTYAGVTTISAGTLQVGNGGSSGLIGGNVNDNAALVFDRSDAVTFSGAIAGNGTLSQNGAGTLVLDGNSSAFTGTTTVQNGTLEIGDAATPSAYLGGNVAVTGGATLRGHGSIGGNVTNAGTVWAGGSIGTLTIQGNYTQSANGVLEVEATPGGQSSLLSVGGSANLAGSALVLADNGNWLTRTNYTILSAAGGISGQFASTTSNFTFLTPTLTYAANQVTLSLQRNNIDFNAVAQTRNQIAVATSLNALSYGNAIYDALLFTNANTARAAFNQISGEIHASVRTAIMDDEHDVRDAVTDHLLDWTQNTGGQTGKLDNGTSVWTAATARGGSHQGDGNASTLDANGGGMLLGVDAPIGDVARVGALIGTGNLSDSVGALDSSAHAHTRHAGFYGEFQLGSFQLLGGAFYGWQNINTDRTVAFPGAAGANTTRYSANTLQAYVDGSYVFTLGHGTLAPFVDVASQRLHTDAYSEAGTAAALSGNAQSNTQTYGTLGLRGAVQVDPQGTVQAHASLGWQHAWGATNATATMQLVSGSDAFTVQGVPVARDAAAITAGFRFLATPRLSLDATYNGQFAHRVNDQAAHLSLTYSF